MDMVALVSALNVAGVMAPVLAISHDDLVEADARYVIRWNATTTTTPNFVSVSLFWYTTVGSLVSVLSIILAVSVRSTIPLMPDDMAVKKWLVPPAMASLFCLLASLLIFIFNGAMYCYVVFSISTMEEIGGGFYIPGPASTGAYGLVLLYFAWLWFASIRSALPKSGPDKSSQGSFLTHGSSPVPATTRSSSTPSL